MDGWHRKGLHTAKGAWCALQKGLGVQGCALCLQGWCQQEPEGVRGLSWLVSAWAGGKQEASKGFLGCWWWGTEV